MAGEVIMSLDGAWEAKDQEGKSVRIPALGDWAQAEGWETFTGTHDYLTSFDLSEDTQPKFIDLGTVGDIAEVWINDQRVGVQAWAPYVISLNGVCHPGKNGVQIRVTNSMTNRHDGRQLPSGLIGPVTLRN